MDEFVDLPEHTANAAIRTAFRRDARIRSLAIAEARDTQSLNGDLPALRDDANRRALFLYDVTRRVMRNGSQHTARYLMREYRFPMPDSWSIIREARRELVAQDTAITQELRAVDSARLEHLYSKAIENLDLTNAVRIVKEHARLHGLYKQEDAGVGDIARLMREITAADDSGDIVDAEFTVLEDDEKEEVTDWKAPEFTPLQEDE